MGDTRPREPENPMNELQQAIEAVTAAGNLYGGRLEQLGEELGSAWTRAKPLVLAAPELLQACEENIFVHNDATFSRLMRAINAARNQPSQPAEEKL